MGEVPTWRLYLMRAVYLLIAVGLGATMWPRMISHGAYAQMTGAAFALFAALSVLMALGVRYPLRMLPILMFELLWKSIWLLFVALPAWRAGPLDAGTLETARECIPGVVICLIAIPWGYAWRHYVREPSDPWRRRPAGDRLATS